MAEIPPTTQVHKFGKSRSVLIVYLDLLVTQLINIFTKFVNRNYVHHIPINEWIPCSSKRHVFDHHDFVQQFLLENGKRFTRPEIWDRLSSRSNAKKYIQASRRELHPSGSSTSSSSVERMHTLRQCGVSNAVVVGSIADLRSVIYPGNSAVVKR